MDPLFEQMLARAKQPAPIQDSLERTAVPADGPAPIPMEAVSPSPEVKPLDPYLTSMLGGLSDTASTYAFLKRGTGREDNSLVAGLADKPGKMAAMGAVTNVAIPMLLKHTLGKKWPRIAQALAANQGALQMGYGAINTQNTLNPRTAPNTAGELGNRKTSSMYSDALISQLRRK